jgi:hypothetical protein
MAESSGLLVVCTLFVFEGVDVAIALVDSWDGGIFVPLSTFNGEPGLGKVTEMSCRHPKRTSTPPVLITKEDLDLYNTKI